MYRRGLVFGFAFLGMATFAQAQQESAEAAPQTQGVVQNSKIIRQYTGPLPPTHFAGQDITYNSHFPPHFPKEAVAAGHYGVVTLLILVNANGEKGEIRVDQSSGYPELDASAVEAAQHWIYTPEVKNGVPQASWVRTPVAFGRPTPPPPPANSL